MRQKISRLRLKVVVRQIQQTTTSNELPSVGEEKQLRELILAHSPLGVIMGSLGKTRESIRCKMARMGLVDDNQLKSKRLLSTNLTLSGELSSVEEALKLFAAISGLSGTVLGIFVEQKS